MNSRHSRTKILPVSYYYAINSVVSKLNMTNETKSRYLLYKKGDTSDPNKWIGVTVMDIGNNIYNIIICKK